MGDDLTVSVFGLASLLAFVIEFFVNDCLPSPLPRKTSQSHRFVGNEPKKICAHLQANPTEKLCVSMKETDMWYLFEAETLQDKLTMAARVPRARVFCMLFARSVSSGFTESLLAREIEFVWICAIDLFHKRFYNKTERHLTEKNKDQQRTRSELSCLEISCCSSGVPHLEFGL